MKDAAGRPNPLPRLASAVGDAASLHLLAGRRGRRILLQPAVGKPPPSPPSRPSGTPHVPRCYSPSIRAAPRTTASLASRPGHPPIRSFDLLLILGAENGKQQRQRWSPCSALTLSVMLGALPWSTSGRCRRTPSPRVLSFHMLHPPGREPTQAQATTIAIRSLIA